MSVLYGVYIVIRLKVLKRLIDNAIAWSVGCRDSIELTIWQINSSQKFACYIFFLNLIQMKEE